MKFYKSLFLFALFALALSHRSNLKSRIATLKDIGDDNKVEGATDDATATSSSSGSSSSSTSSTTSSSSSSTTTTTSYSSSSSSSSDASPAYLNVMKDKSWIYSGNCPDKKKQFSQTTKIPGNANLKVQKKDVLNKRIFSQGNSALVTTVLSTFLSNDFKQEIKAGFQEFASGVTELQVPQIKKGMSTSKWMLSGSLDDLAEFMYGTYNVDGSDGLSEREFAYMSADNTFSYAVNYDCKNCLAKTRWEIDQLFKFMDYDGNGYVQAEDLFQVFKHMKGGEEIKPVNANEWLLKEDIRQIGRLGNTDFTEGVLKSLYEHEYL